MAIISSNPVTIPASDARTYNQWWLKRLVVLAPNVNGAVKASAQMIRYYRDPSGVGAALAGSDATYTTSDLFALAATNPEVASAIDALTTALANVAKAAGVIS